MARNFISWRSFAGGHGGRFVVFGLVGVFNTLSDFLAFMAFLSFGISPTLANIMAFALVNPLSYFINSVVTFRRNGVRAIVSFIGYGKFLGAHLVSLAISTLLIMALAHSIGPLAAKMTGVVVTVFINYIASAQLIFKDPDKP